MEEPKKVAVYFNSGNKAVLETEGLEFRESADPPICLIHGKTLVNWSNVCFVREVEEKHDDDE